MHGLDRLSVKFLKLFTGDMDKTTLCPNYQVKDSTIDKIDILQDVNHSEKRIHRREKRQAETRRRRLALLCN